MTGYYPATYGFENDKTGNFPYGWILENSGGTASIIDSIGDHKKVLQLYDNNGSNGVDLTNLFDSSQSSGTIEWWWRISDVTKISTFEIRDGSSLTITLFVRNSEFQYYRGGYLSVQSVSNDIWYHHRIDFNCGTDKFDWYIDDAKKVDQGNFRTVATSVDRVFLHTQEVDSNFYNYFDAISYFWDTDYTIGDNLNEGLLLSFDLGFSPDWLGYSLDSQTNKTILGNSTIKMPSNGFHLVQVFANNSLGQMYQSGIRYFTILIEPPPTYPGEEESYIILIIIISVSVGVGAMGLVTVGVIYKRKHVPSRDTTPTEPKPEKPIKRRKEKISDSGITINCPFCNSLIKKSQTFCNYCGANIKE